MKRSSLLIILLAMLALGGVLYWYVGRHASKPPAVGANSNTNKAETEKGSAKKTSNTQLRFAADAPQLAHIRIGAVSAFPEPLLEPLNGRVAYDENYTARIATPISGRVVKITVSPGDSVTAGQPLLLIDAPDFSAAVADVSRSSADVRLKQSAFERAKTLHEGEVLARKEFESAQNDLAIAQAEARRAQDRLGNLTQGKGLDGSKFAVRSPIRGVVSERKVNPGAEVRPDANDPLFVVTDPTRLWIIVDVPEKYLGRVAVGQRVGVDTDAFPGAEFNARIASIGEILDPATRRIQVRCVLENPQRRLKPEMFVRVTPMPDDARKLPRIPNSALITEGLYSHVFVEREKGLFEKRRITLGLQGREESYVKDGLTEGDRVVTSGALLLNSDLAGRE